VSDGNTGLVVVHNWDARFHQYLPAHLGWKCA
jgi:hypothetical protein